MLKLPAVFWKLSSKKKQNLLLLFIILHITYRNSTLHQNTKTHKNILTANTHIKYTGFKQRQKYNLKYNTKYNIHSQNFAEMPPD